MAKAVGVGGVFLKARDPKVLSAWYATHLGIPDQGGGSLGFDGPESVGMTVFAHFPADTKYFGDGPQQSMVNFRVDNLDELLAQLGQAGVTHRSQARRLRLRSIRMDLGPRRQPRWNYGNRRRRDEAALSAENKQACDEGEWHRHNAEPEELPGGNLDFLAAQGNQPENRCQ